MDFSIQHNNFFYARYCCFIFASKKSNERRNLSVANQRLSELHAAEMAELPRFPIGPKQGNC